MVLSVILLAVEKVLSSLAYLICVTAILVLCDLFRKRHILKFSRNFKSYIFYPVVGNAYHTIGRDITTVIENAKKKHGIPCSLWNGHDYHYITADASEIKVVLNHPNTFDKGTIYDNFRTSFKNTILLEKYDKWKRNRKIFSRSFSQPILNGFVDIFYEKAYILVNILKNPHERNIYDIFSRLTLDNFCATVMNLDMDVQRVRNDRLVEMVERFQTEMGKRMFTSYFVPNILFAFSPLGRSLLKDSFEIRQFIDNIIQQKKGAFRTERDFRENSNKLPLMDMMLEIEETKFTDGEIFREIFLFLLAATDTSGITLSFTFTLLGMNPEVQEKIYQEVSQIVGLEGHISHNHLPDLKYTERAIFESMRILPVTPVLERHVAADVNLGDKTVPAGANILISVLNLHRSEEHWKNPLEFNPDRFLPEEVARRHPYAFIPFSGGPRNCIGMKYALMMMKTNVAHVIRTYEVRSKYKSVTELNLESFITMKTVHDLDCTFIRRNN